MAIIVAEREGAGVLDKKRLLQQFFLPSDLRGPFGVEWTRSPDFFGDQFALRAQVDESRIKFDYIHKPAAADATAQVWSITIGLTPTGRACIAESCGVEPAVKTVHRAAALVEQATRHLQANPSLARVAPAPRRA